MPDSATLSTKFRISIPKAVRERQQWKAGQRFVFIPKGKGVLLVPPLARRPARHRQGRAGRGLARPGRSRLMRLVNSAAEMARTHRLATAGAIIYASALAHGAEVLTCDAHFEGLSSVTFLSKAAR